MRLMILSPNRESSTYFNFSSLNNILYISYVQCDCFIFSPVVTSEIVAELTPSFFLSLPYIFRFEEQKGKTIGCLT